MKAHSGQSERLDVGACSHPLRVTMPWLSPHSVTQAAQHHTVAAPLGQPLVLLFFAKISEPCSCFLGFSWSPLPTTPTNTARWLVMYLTHCYTLVCHYSRNEITTSRATHGKQDTRYFLRRDGDQGCYSWKAAQNVTSITLTESHFMVEMRGLNLIMSTVVPIRVVAVKLSNLSELSLLISKMND